MCEQYNGWSNRETWLVGVWGFFDDDRIEEVLRDTISDKRYGYEAIVNNPKLGGVSRALTLYLADWMEQEFDDYLDEIWSVGLRWDFSSGGFVKDLMGDHKINWLEIAEHYSEQIADALSQSVTK